ncbi:MAG: hypothetical protein MMC33_008122 [Icmadophila ericetorum]|nr:hypothetical protein [Icmadophila ericetorum]
MKTSTLLVFCAALLTSTPIAAPSPQGSTGFQTLLEFDDANFNDLYDLEAPADGTIFTITSPRPSITSITSPSATSSRRTSTETITRSSQAGSPSRNSSVPPLQPQQRRTNRAALRDYYGLKAASSAAPTAAATAAAAGDGSVKVGKEHGADGEEVKESELDRDGFDAEAYVKEVLGREGLEGLMAIEGGLINEIRGLDGEKKALVYDNYSKLIAATDTIRKMRTNMDPLTPKTSTLSQAIAHIAETTTFLADSLRDRTATTRNQRRGPSDEGLSERRKKVATVKWVLDTPRRLQELLIKGATDDAMSDWQETKRLLDKWEGTEGVEQVRQDCLRVLEEKSNGAES